MTPDGDIDIRVAVPARADVGEGPVWNPETGALHWVDILAGHINTSDLDTGATTTHTVPTFVGAATRRVTGGFVAATTDGFAEVGDDGTYRPRVDLLPDGIRMNDAKCDRHGRFWAGSTAMDFAAGQGALHVLDPDWTSRVVLDRISQPNGIGWSPDDSVLYLVDTAELLVLAFDVDRATCALTRRRVLREFPGTTGIPDGLSVDAAGCLWVAMWGGGRLVRLAPEGDLLAELPVPVTQPSSCAFVGPGLGTLCVTSARRGLDLAPDDDGVDGSVLAISGVGVAGTPVGWFGG
jgi:sugar lactone lactonase YvrE